MQFTDAVTVAGTRRRDDGYLVADARIARTGIQTYLGSEVGRNDMARVRVYRPGAEVFADATLRSAAHRPVTNDHPAQPVTSANWREHAVGQTGDEVAGEGIFIRVPLMVSDEAAIKDIEAGKRELSAGYTCDLDFTAGTTPTGETYDAIQKNIRFNHVAIVKRGRAGSQVRIGDAAASWGAAPITSTQDKETVTMSDALRTVVVDGLSVLTTDQGAQAIEKLTKALADAKTTSDAAIATKDGEIAGMKKAFETKDGEIAALKKQVDDARITPAALAQMVKDRAALVENAKRIGVKDGIEDLSDEDIRRKAVAVKLGDEAVKTMTADAVAGAFAVLVKAAPTDPLRNALKDGVTVNVDDRDAAYREYLDGLKNGYRASSNKGAN